ncbi:hypothetical protein D6D23_10066 [Aureobasidium pullulans]|uniref:F-box domain-containing protein n=1 Tax=Aureobasidium pullulans TaxID=5580 RepID=A0A4S9J1G0_AURPU|nr:hypothetical protein D6D24_08719 [Aureobasidium pullulans]THW12659.1 hypothetical protein D6D23_10066 [Aureobasidium pullulans]THX36058.1 hypothetical protein D6D10_07000 [Aureobasidium pullulans]THX95124.1 hypothetical protein D6D03_09370 [Aureobasidium pullulans]THZ19328.1 hypothetical protein D6C89_07806 [Aureobasidium pullulans]
MDTLPPELKQRICNYLTPKDLKSFRLTSTDYAAAASRYLLPRIFLLNHPDSFQEVQDIVNHPELSQQVTTLVIDVCRLKQYPRYDHWARVFAAPSPASTDNQGSVEARAITTGDVDARSERILRREKNLEQWKSYQIQARAQARKSTVKLMLECIALAFQKCSKLRNLIIDLEPEVGDVLRLDRNNRNACGLSEKRNHFYRDIFSSPATRRSSARRLYWDHIRFDLWDILKPVDDVDRALDSLTVLDTLYDSGTLGWTLPTTSIFRNLKHLRESRCSPDFLISIVACAPKLESLGIIDYRYHHSMAFALRDLLEKTSSKSLRACSLMCISDGDAIARFVLRHSGTLQSFTLGDVSMISPSSTMWTSLAARLKGQLPHLKRLKLINLTKPLVFDPTTGFRHPVEFLTTDDILQNHEHELQTGPMELENGLWEDYELRFFPQ